MLHLDKLKKVTHTTGESTREQARARERTTGSKREHCYLAATSPSLLNMNSTATVSSHPCLANTPGNLAIFCLVVIFPFHVFVLATLHCRILEKCPRHKFLISLSISDNLQIAVTGLFAIISRAFHLRTTSTSCQVLRQVIEFSASLISVSTSASIVALSIERYISCVYCLRAYAILTNKRVNTALFTLWTLAFVCGCIVLHPSTPNLDASPISREQRLSVVYAVVVISSSIVMLIIQVRLYTFARQKLKVQPARLSCAADKAEATDLRRRHLKLAFIASVVAGAYIICMLPMSCFIGYRLISGDRTSFPTVRTVLSFLAILNTLVDPFIYSLGMKDTRKIIVKQFKSIKQQCLSIFEKN